ncbi:MAG: YhcN/YlaJ family sporulation lipoprotein [Thermoanaerobacteraceae bacterium]
MKKIKSIITLMIAVVMVMTSLAGCKTATKKPTPTRFTPAPTRTAPTPTPPAPGYTTPAPRTPTSPATPVKKSSTESTRAEKIATAVARIPEVNKTTVVITGNTALVGVDMKAKVQGTTETELKKKIAKTVKDTDKSIKNVSVTADPDLYKRIDNISKGIAEGRPISEFAKQIAEIIKRITPSM